jgi:hypothetical protein
MPTAAGVGAVLSGVGALGQLFQGGEGQDPVGQINFLPQASEEELRILAQAIGAGDVLAQDISQIPPSLSLAALGAPIGGPTETQRGLVEDVIGAQEAPLMAQLENLMSRLSLNRDRAVRGLREAQAGTGIRGTTAGSANIGFALSELNRPVEEFARTSAGELSRLRGGGAQALLELPFRERGLQLEARGRADAARAAIMGNPVLERFFRERVAQGAAVPLVPGETAVNPFTGLGALGQEPGGFKGISGGQLQQFRQQAQDDFTAKLGRRV